MITYRRRYALAGALFGAMLAAGFVLTQYGADARGVRILGVAEAMTLVSLPVSLLSWAAVVLGGSLSGLPRDAETPHWVVLLWLGLTPVLNWAFLGLLLGAVRDGRRRQPSAGPAA